MDCPHCKVDIPGVTTEATVKERVDAKQRDVDAKGAEIVLLKASLVTKTALAASAQALTIERDTAVKALSDHKSEAGRASSLRGIGVDTATDDGQAVQKAFLALYASDQVGVAEADQRTFEDWVGNEEGARKNPLLASYFTDEAVAKAAAEAAARAAGVGSKKGLFNKDTNVTTPPLVPGKKMDRYELQAFLEKKTPDEVRAWQKEHGEQYGMKAFPEKPTAPGA